MPYFRLIIPIYDISSIRLDPADHIYFSIGRWYMIWEWSETAFSVSSPISSWSDFLILPVVFGSILQVSAHSSQKHLGICVCGNPGFDSVSSIINYENRHFHEEDKKNTEFRATQFEVHKNCIAKVQTNRGLVRYKLLCFFFFYFCCCCYYYDCF